MNNIINNDYTANNSTYKAGLNKNDYSSDLQKNFLNLLIAQIKNQDPIDPMKNTELTSQLAHINTVSQMEKLNHTVTELTYHNKQNQNIQASSLIGRHVLIPTTELMHTKNVDTKFGIELFDYATLVNIQIKDEKGNIVFNKDMTDVEAGLYHLSWNGKNLNNDDVDTGRYNLDATAQNKHNNNVAINAFSESLVESIIPSSPKTSYNTLINLGLAGTTKLSNIHEILA